MAQIIIVKQVLCRNQNVAHPRKREEIQPRVVRYTPLDVCRAQTSRDCLHIEGRRYRGI